MNAPAQTAPEARALGRLAEICAVARHEWRALAYAPLSPVFLSGFLLALMACVFLIADFYSTDSASIEVMLTFLPWVAMVFVPALAMRAWSGEPSDRSLELILSLPIRTSSLVVGKWLARGALLLTGLLLTAPFVATIGYLGSPDWGVVLAGYWGAALLLVTFLAVALLAAAAMREPVGGFVLGVALLFVLMLPGWDVFGRLLRGHAGAGVLEAMPLISPKHWLDRMAAGDVELTALVYLATATAIALLGTAWLIEGRRAGPVRPAGVVRGAGWAVVLIAAGALVVAAAHQAPSLGFDLTAEKEFTLHPRTLEIIARQPAGTEIDFYWSAGETAVPADIRLHARRARDLLRSVAARSNGRVALREHDTRPDTQTEAQARAAGIRRIPMSSGDAFMLGAILRHGGRQGRIEYFDIRREQLLEYDVALALNSLGQTRTRKVGLLSPLLSPRNVKEPREGLSFLEELKRAYDVVIIPHFADALPPGLDVLLVIDATVLKHEMLYAIDQHIMAGHGLVAMIDPQVRFNRASNIVTPQPSAEINDVSDLLLRYGARYLGTEVVGDSELASLVVDEDQQQLVYPYWVRIRRDGLSGAHPVTAGINEITFAEPGALSLASEGATALVTTTKAAGVLPREEFAGKSPRALAARFTPGGGKRVLAAALSGPFASAFPAAPEGRPPDRFRPRSEGSAAVFVIADVDWIFDPFSVQQVRSGAQVLTMPLNDNFALLLNMVEYAAGDPALIAIRSRGRLQRPFTLVSTMLNAAQLQYGQEEAEFAQRVAKVEATIASVLEAAGVSRAEQLPQAVQSQLRGLLTELLPARARLREIRLIMREEVETLGRRMTLFNLLAGPILVIGLFLALRRFRPRWTGAADRLQP
jgi:ABC-2 type transport system permease protein